MFDWFFVLFISCMHYQTNTILKMYLMFESVSKSALLGTAIKADIIPQLQRNEDFITNKLWVMQRSVFVSLYSLTLKSAYL